VAKILTTKSQTLQISLPKQSSIKLYTEPDNYGASNLISSALRLPFTPRSFAYWLHGWNSVPLKYIELFGVDWDGLYLVARQEEMEFLKKNNKKAVAIGAPFIYTDYFTSICELQRKANSLLVLPPHGMSYTTEKWNESMYVEEIASVINDFEFVAVCISPNDIEKNKWVDSFKKINIPIIEGARVNDKNALLRMRSLFNQFEFVTTNSLGSHVAYAAYAGAKVSFFGHYQYYDIGDTKKDDLHKLYPKAFEYLVEEKQERNVRKRYGHLFYKHPSHARLAINYAKNWLGFSEKKAPIEVANLLKWWPHQQIYQFSKKAYIKFKRAFNP